MGSRPAFADRPGSKGSISRKTPHEILDRCERLSVDPGPLRCASRIAAKVDSAALQDGYQLRGSESRRSTHSPVERGLQPPRSISQRHKRAARADVLRPPRRQSRYR
ncbi:MAG: DUF763 domain-containing protein [bacterium]